MTLPAHLLKFSGSCVQIDRILMEAITSLASGGQEVEQVLEHRQIIKQVEQNTICTAWLAAGSKVRRELYRLDAYNRSVSKVLEPGEIEANSIQFKMLGDDN